MSTAQIFSCLFSLLLLSQRTVFSQKQDSLAAETCLASALRSLKNGRNDSFQIANEQFFQIARQLDNLNFWWRGQSKIAYFLSSDLNRPFDALELTRAARQRSWRNNFVRREWEAHISSHLASAYIAQHGIRDFMMTKNILEEAFSLFQRQLDEQSDNIANYVYFQLGNTYSRLGDYKKAEQMHLRGLEYWKKRGQPGKGRFSDLAIVYRNLRNLPKTLETLEEGLRQTNDPRLISYLLTEQITTLIEIKNVPQAWAVVQKLEKHLTRHEKPLSEWLLDFQSSIFEAKAQLFVLENKNDTALQNFQKAIETASAYRGANSREVAKIRAELAYFQLKIGKNTDALHQFQQMLQAVLPDFRPTDDLENPDPATFKAENTIFEALEGKAKVFEKMGDLEAALRCYELIPQVEELLRQTYAYESSALFSLEESRKRFEHAVELAWQIFQKTGRQDIAERAFFLTEQARGVLLLKSLTKAKADLENLLPPADLQKLREFRAKTAWYELRIAEKKATNEDFVELDAELFNLKQQQTIFETQLRKSHLNWAQVSEKIEFFTAPQVKNLLRPAQAMLSYFFSDSAVFIFHFQKNGKMSWRRAPLPIAFRARSHGFADYLTHSDAAGEGIERFFRTSTELAALLVAPEIAQFSDVRSLVIIPDDVLVFIPFEIMILQNQQPPAALGWHHFEYLIKRFSINYAYSATLLRMQQDLTKNRKPAPKYWAGFAPSYNRPPDTDWQKMIVKNEARGDDYDLRGTHVEVEKIQKLVGGERRDGSAASETEFRRIANQFQILHFAMHGMANEDAPELSRLLFGDRAETPPDDDNVLYASELQIMQLQAGLAVLSACHTGFGRMRRGEGVYSLARAFTAAGVPATVMSLWRLPDNTAPVLMENFYRHLAAGLPKDEALRLAKTDFLATDSLAYFNHPYFWAGITSNGDAAPMPAPGGNFWWWLAGGAAAVFCLIFGFLKFRKRAGTAS